MKRNIFYLFIIICSLASEQIQAQSLKDLFTSPTVQDAIKTVLNGKELTIENLTGTWEYKNPTVEFESDNLLKDAAAKLIANEIEKKMTEYFLKAGIKEGSFDFTFSTDSTFKSNFIKKELFGDFSIDNKEQTIELRYGRDEIYTLMTSKATIIINEKNQMRMLFNADKLFEFITKLSSTTNNNSLKAINKMIRGYKGMKLGFELIKSEQQP